MNAEEISSSIITASPQQAGQLVDVVVRAFISDRRAARLRRPLMSAIGTSRPIAALQYSGRYWSKSGHREALALSGVGRERYGGTSDFPLSAIQSPALIELAWRV
jgi:hypothetical protein